MVAKVVGMCPFFGDTDIKKEGFSRTPPFPKIIYTMKKSAVNLLQ